MDIGSIINECSKTNEEYNSIDEMPDELIKIIEIQTEHDYREFFNTYEYKSKLYKMLEQPLSITTFPRTYNSSRIMFGMDGLSGGYSEYTPTNFGNIEFVVGNANVKSYKIKVIQRNPQFEGASAEFCEKYAYITTVPNNKIHNKYFVKHDGKIALNSYATMAAILTNYKKSAF